ncbi:hypothetical protein [Burkholderia sp. SCN-KJ]|uniref:hypothetical protein n=1 Tax=Burkholderia sp. SCN-KJ TaxID=2969248 RepID=UPI002150630C|nr:hypothetical protein [Burkholderia sp. SCN-KJ]MCR4471604.1 hypothetical protein [Burkholderia sp. SCN-KJ]
MNLISEVVISNCSSGAKQRNVMRRVRMDAAAAANAEDTAIWRWFSALLEERRVGRRYLFNRWVLNVDQFHVATEQNFYEAIRVAKWAATERD